MHEIDGACTSLNAEQPRRHWPPTIATCSVPLKCMPTFPPLSSTAWTSPSPPPATCPGLTCWRTPRRECGCPALPCPSLVLLVCTCPACHSAVHGHALPPCPQSAHPPSAQLEAERGLPAVGVHGPAHAAGQDDVAGAPPPRGGPHPAGPARGEALGKGAAAWMVETALALALWCLGARVTHPPAPPTLPPSPGIPWQMITYGLRGLAAYTHHAEMLGQRDPEVCSLWCAGGDGRGGGDGLSACGHALASAAMLCCQCSHHAPTPLHIWAGGQVCGQGLLLPVLRGCPGPGQGEGGV